MTNKAFTMIEILVVITIIGILLGVGALSYSSLTKSSRDAKRKTDLEQIRAALEMYRSSEPAASYPDFSGDCSSLSSVSNFSSYLPLIPADPKNVVGWNYSCESTSVPGDYQIYSTLENSESPSCGGDCGSGGSPAVECEYAVGPYGKICGP